MSGMAATIEGGSADTSAPEVTGNSLPGDIAARLSDEQITRLKQMLAARSVPHPVDYRVSTSLFGYRFYVAFFAGTEARSWDRLRAEQQLRPLRHVLRDGLAVSVIVTAVLCMFAGAAIIGMQVLKTLTGINLFLH